MDAEVHEKIGVLSAKADAAHNRIDRLEGLVRADLSEIKAELKELIAHMHQGKGWWGGANWMMMLIGGVIGFLVTAAVRVMF